MKEKKYILLLLVCALMMWVISPCYADASRTYGADNLNNSKGELVIGFIGGSITEGTGASSVSNRYTTLLVNEYFKEKYPEKEVVEVNAAIGGTTSSYGMMRMHSDLRLDAENTPDVVFIEFAANDRNVGSSQMRIQNMESMVRELLALPKVPVIIFVYTTVSVSNAVNEPLEIMETTIADHHAVAENYGIYEINIHDYVWEGVEKGTWNFVNDGSSEPFIVKDNVHPNDYGHRLYAEYMAELLERDKALAFKKVDIYAPPIGSYVHGKIEEIPLSDASVRLSGGWDFVKTTPPADLNIMGNYAARFLTDGYYVSESCTGETLEMEFEGSGFGINYIRTRDSGTANWELIRVSDSAAVGTGSLSMYSTDERPVGRMLKTGLDYGRYRLVITGAKDENASGTGESLDIAYIAVDKGKPGIAPAAENVKIIGDAVSGGVLTAAYDYNGHGFFDEGSTRISWLLSDNDDGEFTEISSEKNITLKNEYRNRRIKLAVTPVNSEGTEGKTVYTSSVMVSKPAGTLKFAAKPEVTDSAVSASVHNSDYEDCSVTMCIAAYAYDNGVKEMTGLTRMVKTVPAGKTEDFLLAADMDSSVMYQIIAYDSFNLEPVSKAGYTVNYMGTEEDIISIYHILP